MGVWLFFRRKKQPRNMARGKQSYPEVYTSPPHVTDNKHGVSQVDTAPAYNVQEMEGSPTQHG
jgi:tRNA nucleotidyltransferase (CCA-adding enzyme)